MELQGLTETLKGESDEPSTLLRLLKNEKCTEELRKENEVNICICNTFITKIKGMYRITHLILPCLSYCEGNIKGIIMMMLPLQYESFDLRLHIYNERLKT